MLNPHELSDAIPFATFESVCKGMTDPETGLPILKGPLTHSMPDMQEDSVELAGLEYFQRNGLPVDWEHKYHTSQDPAALVGRGVKLYRAPHPVDGEQVWWMDTALFNPELKPLVRDIVSHLDAGGTLGYSVAGMGVRIPATGKVKTVVATVALTAQPVQQANCGTIEMVSKAFRRAERDELPLTRLHLPLWGPGGDFWRSVQKALEATGSLPPSGPGVDAVACYNLSADKEERKRRRRQLKRVVMELAAGSRR